MSMFRVAGLVAVMTAGCLSSAQAQIKAPPGFVFDDVSSQVGIERYRSAGGMGAGMNAVDYNGDGLVDLYVPNGSGNADQLYRNDGQGRFEEVAAAVGLASTRDHRVAVWFDYDGDRRLDLLTAAEGNPSLQLYRQKADGTFENTTVQAELDFHIEAVDADHRGGLCAADYDRDGDIDFYVASWGANPHLMQNDGDGTFSDATTASGVDAITQAQNRQWQPNFSDLNGDGWADLSLAIDGAPDLIFINQQDGTFVDVAPDHGLDVVMHCMGRTTFDYDNDGDFDLASSNIVENTPNERNVLFRNDSGSGSLAFTEISEIVGVDDGGWGWGITYADFNNDGFVDHALTNGFFVPYPADASRFFLSRGGSTPVFDDVSSMVGFDDMDWGSALAAFDYDRDGDMDLAILIFDESEIRVLNNRTMLNTNGAGTSGLIGCRNHFLTVKPRMVTGNTYAIGAIVQVHVGDLTMTRQIHAGTSFMSQEPFEAHFGLGTANIADMVKITFPDGTQKVLKNVPADKVITVYPSKATTGMQAGK